MIVTRIDFEEYSKNLSNKDKYFFHGDAKKISPRLLLFQYRKKIGGAWSLDLPRYHVIHAATGLVIADVEYSEVATVKKSFEKEQWTLTGNNTLSLYNRKFTFAMTCHIRYVVEN